MTKQIFMEQLIKELYHFFSSKEYDLEGKIFLKNNDTKRYAVILKKINGNVAPTVYLDDFYEEFMRNKATISEIAQYIFDQTCGFEEKMQAYESFSAEFDDCKDKITFRLVSGEKNTRYLENVPHIPFLNMSIIFYIIHRVSKEGMESICITNELAARWNLTTKDLFERASVNTPKLLPPVIDTMRHTIEQLVIDTDESFDFTEGDDSVLPMHIMTNTYQINGASVILYEGVLDDLAETLDADLYVLPSSIHEMIIMPVEDETTSLAKLSEMVRDINKNHVREEEILSDCAYYYNRIEKKFYM